MDDKRLFYWFSVFVDENDHPYDNGSYDIRKAVKLYRELNASSLWCYDDVYRTRLFELTPDMIDVIEHDLDENIIIQKV